MPRSLNFYFGSVVFFLGILMTAIGISNLVAERLNFTVLVALITGLILITIGYVVGKGKGPQDTHR